jgi:hypothetical protein
MFVDQADSPAWIWLLPFWPLGFLVAWGLLKTAIETREEKRITRSVAWPEVQGKITRVDLVWAHIAIQYEYKALGKWLEGTYRVHLGPFVPSGWHVAAAAGINRGLAGYSKEYAVGSKIIVRYNPANPAESVLYCKGEPKTATEGPKIEPHFLTLK